MTEAKRSMSLMAEMIGMIVALGRKMTDDETTIYGQVSWEGGGGMRNHKIFSQSAVFIARGVSKWRKWCPDIVCLLSFNKR